MDVLGRSRDERCRLVYAPVRILALLSICALPGALGAQDTDTVADTVEAGGQRDGTVIEGRVVDGATGEGVPRVSVLLSSGRPGERPFYRTTDAEGRFTLVITRAGVYDAAFVRFGYASVGDTLRVVGDQPIELVAEMVPRAVVLDPISVTADRRVVHRTQLDGFFERRENFPGDFLTHEEIEQMDPADLSQLLVMVGSFRMVPGQGGSRSRVLGRGGCPPTYYLNGTPLVMSPVDIVETSQLEAMEVYAGSQVPAEFQTAPAFVSDRDYGLTTGSCGTVVLWTQDGERERRAAAPETAEESDRSWFPMVWVLAATTGTILFGR